MFSLCAARPVRAALLALVVGLTAASAASPASASGPVDQQQLTQDGAIAMPPGLAQTFTVDRDGRLDGLTLWSTTTGPIAYQFYDLRADGTPDVTKPRLAGNGSAALLAGQAIQIGFAPIAVKAGDRLALALGTVGIMRSTSRATASLTWGAAQQALAGKVVTFRLLRSDGALKDTCSATTDASGVARCSKRWSLPGGGAATATFAGDADYLPSTATTTS